MKGGLSVGCRTKIFGNAQCRFENENVKCQDSFNHWILFSPCSPECRCQPNFTLSAQCRVKNLVNVRCRNNPFHGPYDSNGHQQSILSCMINQIESNVSECYSVIRGRLTSCQNNRYLLHHYLHKWMMLDEYFSVVPSNVPYHHIRCCCNATALF